MAYGTTRGALQGHGRAGTLPVEQRSAGQLRWCRGPHSSSSLEAPTTQSGLTRGHWQQGPGQTGHRWEVQLQLCLVSRPRLRRLRGHNASDCFFETGEAAQVIEELIELARKVREEKGRTKLQNMSEDELAFYDALGVNDSAVQVLGNETLRQIALDLTQMIRKSVTIDWTQRRSVQAEIRVKVKKILRKYGYPPDKQEKATQTVLEQAEIIAARFSRTFE